jgi:hypothetical protein
VDLSTLQMPVLLVDVSTLQRTMLHLDVSTLHVIAPVLVFTIEVCAASRLVYTKGAGDEPGRCISLFASHR